MAANKQWEEQQEEQREEQRKQWEEQEREDNEQGIDAQLAFPGLFKGGKNE